MRAALGSPGRADDMVNEVPGSKPVPVDEGAREKYSEPQVAFELTIEEELSSYDQAVTLSRLASLYGVNASDVTIRLAAGSLVLRLSIRARGDDGGAALQARIGEVGAAALSTSLGAAAMRTEPLVELVEKERAVEWCAAAAAAATASRTHRLEDRSPPSQGASQ